jgi:Flp pilus assembly pilin Flp
MIKVMSWARSRFTRHAGPHADGDQRGATLVEYALLVSLMIGGTLIAIQSLTSNSGDYLSSTGSNIGEPREHIADMDPDLPDPPAWLP